MGAGKRSRRVLRRSRNLWRTGNDSIRAPSSDWHPKRSIITKPSLARLIIGLPKRSWVTSSDSKSSTPPKSLSKSSQPKYGNVTVSGCPVEPRLIRQKWFIAGSWTTKLSPVTMGPSSLSTTHPVTSTTPSSSAKFKTRLARARRHKRSRSHVRNLQNSLFLIFLLK